MLRELLWPPTARLRGPGRLEEAVHLAGPSVEVYIGDVNTRQGHAFLPVPGGPVTCPSGHPTRGGSAGQGQGQCG